MTEDSLKDMVNDQGAGAFQDAVYNKYDSVLAREELFGEPLDTPDLHLATRKYDHGQASEQTVVEYGIKIVFDSDEVSVEDLEDDGAIQTDLMEMAKTHLSVTPAGYDLTFVTEDAYEVWILLPERLF